MASERQVEANRRNAQKSTGPRTEAGKAVSRANAVTHGLLSNVVLIADDSEQEALALLREQMREDLQPLGVLEEFLVDRMVSAMWRLRRALRVEAAVMEMRADRAELVEVVKTRTGPYFDDLEEEDEEDEDEDEDTPQKQTDPQIRLRGLLGTHSVSLVQRYEKEIERQFYRALTELQKLQSARRQAAAEETEAGASDPLEAGAVRVSAGAGKEKPASPAAAPVADSDRPSP